MQIERLTAKDYEEATDFINMVFSMAHCPFDFIRFLPRLYKPTDDCMKWNLVVREGGRIRALVGMYPDTVQAGGETLLLGGIGAVASHPNDRGKGWMKLLMDRQVGMMDMEGYDLSFLIGQRQRYQYFGYDKSGVLLEYKLNRSNLKHSGETAGFLPVRWEPLLSSDIKRIKQAKALHDSQQVYCVRPLDDFYLYLQTGYTQPWAALAPDASLLGYAVSSPGNKKVTELMARDTVALDSMVRAWFSQQNVEEATFVLSSSQQGITRYLGTIAEDMQVVDNGNWRICNWSKVIRALLRVKSQQHQMTDGVLRICIQGYGVIQIEVCGKCISCNSASGDADILWDALTATRVIFGNGPFACVTAIPPSAEPILSSWFPLPLSWLPQNYV